MDIFFVIVMTTVIKNDRFSKIKVMDQRDFVKLTSALYRVTDLFPEQEPLKSNLRDWSLKILTELSPYHFSNDSNLDQETADQCLRDVRTLRSLLEVAQGQKWVHEINLLLLDQEYSRLEDKIKDALDRIDQTERLPKDRIIKEDASVSAEKESKKENHSVVMQPSRAYNLPNDSGKSDAGAPSDRQNKILKMIRQRPRIQMRQIQEQLTDVTSRTLRRDLESLVQQKKIIRIGRGTGTFYQINFGDNS